MKNMSIELEWILKNLEENIDENEEERLNHEWDLFWDGKIDEPYFLPKRSAKDLSPILNDLQHVTVNDALTSYDKMICQQLEGVLKMLSSDNGKLLSVRPNFGTPTLATYFPIEIVKMADELDCLPANYPVKGGEEVFRKIADKGDIDDIPAYDNFATKALEMGEIMLETFSKYPKIAKYVHIYHPDTQGPMDLLEIMWGSDIFVDAYTCPEVLHDMLGIITRLYIKYIDYWLSYIPQYSADKSVHWGMVHKGRVFLRNDSAMNFSPDMYREFFLPYDSVLCERYGAAMHFCGRGDHYIPIATEMKGLHAINLSQPHLNDMDILFESSIDKGVYILDLERNCTIESAKARPLHGRVLCQ